MAITQSNLTQIKGIPGFANLEEVLNHLLAEINDLKKKVAQLESEKK